MDDPRQTVFGGSVVDCVYQRFEAKMQSRWCWFVRGGEREEEEGEWIVLIVGRNGSKLLSFMS